MAKKSEEQKSRSWQAIKIVFWMIILAIILANITGLFFDSKFTGNIAMIKLDGVITADGRSTFTEKTIPSQEIVKNIEKADNDPTIKAIVIEINSPGGSAVASKEIATAVKKTKKQTIALIREVGASGAYWVASASDKIVADELSITGSIGVISSYVEYAGLLDRYNLTYRRLVAGERKDIGDPFRQLTKEEEAILGQKLGLIHGEFIKSVAENRNIGLKTATEIADGGFYLGLEAKDIGLIDVLGDKDTVKDILKQELNLTTVDFREYKIKKGFWETFAEAMSEPAFRIGQGIGSALTAVKKENNLLFST